METRKFTLCDDDGKSHSYELIPHAPEEGLDLTFRMIDMTGPVAGKLIAGLLEGKKDFSSIMDGDLSGAAMGEAVELLAGELVRNGKPLIKELLKNATRDGKPLDNPAHFSTAYQANYGELMEATIKVVEQNGFHRFLSRILRKGGGLFRKMVMAAPRQE